MFVFAAAQMLDPDQFLETELAAGKPESTMDEDLTSLSWLQDSNLLKGLATLSWVVLLHIQGATKVLSALTNFVFVSG